MNAELTGKAFDSAVSHNQIAEVLDSSATRSSHYGACHHSSSGGHPSRESINLRHDGTTEIDSSNIVDAASASSFECPSLAIHEAKNVAIGVDPSPHPELSDPKASGEEFVGSIDMSSSEAEATSNSADIPVEESLEGAALYGSLEGINRTFDDLHGSNLFQVILAEQDQNLD